MWRMRSCSHGCSQPVPRWGPAGARAWMVSAPLRPLHRSCWSLLRRSLPPGWSRAGSRMSASAWLMGSWWVWLLGCVVGLRCLLRRTFEGVYGFPSRAACVASVLVPSRSPAQESYAAGCALVDGECVCDLSAPRVPKQMPTGVWRDVRFGFNFPVSTQAAVLQHAVHMRGKHMCYKDKVGEAGSTARGQAPMFDPETGKPVENSQSHPDPDAQTEPRNTLRAPKAREQPTYAKPLCSNQPAHSPEPEKQSLPNPPRHTRSQNPYPRNPGKQRPPKHRQARKRRTTTRCRFPWKPPSQLQLQLRPTPQPRGARPELHAA